MFKPIAITCGDPAGVGPEVIEEWLKHETTPGEFCLIGPSRWLERFNQSQQTCAVGDRNFVLTPGKPSAEGAAVALAALEESAEGCRQGRYSAVVTAPVSKYELSKIGYKHPGQTEFFAERWGGTPTMAFAGGKLAVVLATWHIPLMSVATALTEEVLTLAVERANELAVKLGAVHPRLGVCGLNPHAGEEGLLGTEEAKFIDPLLNRLRQRFAGLSKALPGDTVFQRQLHGDFDVVIALYHDQGLAPLKTFEFDLAVNITLGLPWLRTSPDHGTAFDLAGKGKADHRSFANAVVLAKKLRGSR